MGFWRKTTDAKTRKGQEDSPWIPLTSEEQLDDIINRSFEKQQLIFKHSTRCGISSMVKNQFISEYALNEGEADLYYLDLLRDRKISDLISTRFDVWHESPQLIVLKDGKVIAHASHGAILNLTF